MRAFTRRQNPAQRVKSASTAAPMPSDRIRTQGFNRDSQRTVGNQAVQRLLAHSSENLAEGLDGSATTRVSHDFSRVAAYRSAHGAIQPKLTIHASDDVYEQEADSVADHVIGRREQKIAQPDSSGPTISVHGVTTGTLDLTDDIEDRLNRNKSGGTPLAGELRAFLVPRFHFDFSKVRVHQDSEATQISQELGARAFTHGTDIYFGAGQYIPSSTEGRRLVVHELVHVAQQERFQLGTPTVQCESIYEYARNMVKPERVLEFIGKWGRNSSPFNIAKNYVKLHWKGVSYWRDVRRSASTGRALLDRVDGLERGARALKKATDEQYSAESKLPAYPLQRNEKSGPVLATADELEYVEKYYNTAAQIANDAMAANSELRDAIAGWDGVVQQANQTDDFTRSSAWSAINDLNLRFNNEGGDFRAYLVSARDRAALVESWARSKQYHAADMLGKWTPQGYQPPPGPF
jgi:hypothetical protein